VEEIGVSGVCQAGISREPAIVVIAGPTAVGKTEVSIEAAKRIRGEIICCDSMQIYRGMNIGTDKPRQEQREAVPHYMLDICDPDEEFSAVEFARVARSKIKEIVQRNRTPVLVGGSGLYVRAVIDGVFEGPAADRALRNRLYEEAEEHGSEYLFRRLITVDPVAGSRIHPNDIRRIVRALEVHEKTGVAISILQSGAEPFMIGCNLRMFGLCRERKELVERIEQRVERMFEEGFVEEVKKLLSSPNPMSITARQALGYKHVIVYLEGRCSLEQAKDILKRDTRRFARRQMTWFRKDRRIVWVEAGREEEPASVAERILRATEIGTGNSAGS
jgi:tRNA dimethylallyltransferase